MKDFVKKMNGVLTDWKDKFDLSHHTPLQFMVDQQGCLCFNDKPFLIADVPELESATLEAEQIVFFLSGNRRIYVQMAWPEEESPCVNSVMLGYSF